MKRALFVGSLLAAALAACNSADFTSQSPPAKNAKQQDAAVVGTPRPVAATSAKPSADALPKTVNPAAGSSSPASAATTTPAASTDANAVNNGQVQVQQPDSTDVIYAGPKVFHVGDGQDAGSSCLGKLGSYPVVGTTYWFEFTVTTPGTTVNVKVSNLCGVDYPDTNFLMIVPGGTGGTNFTQHVLIPSGGQTSITLQSTPLAPGRYAAAIKSTRGSDTPDASPDDMDDFIFANVQITGSSSINSGPVNATSEPDCKEVVTDPTGDTTACD